MQPGGIPVWLASPLRSRGSFHIGAACADYLNVAREALRHKMSLMRQAIVKENDPARGVSISTLAREYPRGFYVERHAHGSDQLIYASRGVMHVTSAQHLWMIPPHFGLWIPARTLHEIRMPESVSMRTLYLRRGLANLGRACTVLHVGPLLRELIFETVRVGSLRPRNRVESALRELLVAELRRASPVPTMLTLPADGRALRVAQAAMTDLRLQATLHSTCAAAGISVRTLERIFRREVGTDFETWRRHVRLMKAVELLVSRSSVKEAAFAVGYQQPNALVELFRRTFGATPKAWAASLLRRSG
jgi:AraC-like DNA-binding protein